MTIITWVAILVSALYINASIIIQIPYFNFKDHKSLVWIGLAHFNAEGGKTLAKLNIGETVAEYIMTI